MKAKILLLLILGSTLLSSCTVLVCAPVVLLNPAMVPICVTEMVQLDVMLLDNAFNNQDEEENNE